MNLLDRYLLAVKKYLPWKRQDDILAELRRTSNRSWRRRKAIWVGPSLPTEMQDWVKHLGQPMVMAARYQPQRYLIGPTIFPDVSVGVAPRAPMVPGDLLGGQSGRDPLQFSGGSALLAAVLGAPWSLIITAAWVTAVFAAVEFAMTHSPAKFPANVVDHVDWSPGSLPDERRCRLRSQTSAQLRPRGG